MIYLGPAPLALSPQAHAHHKAPAIDLEDLERVHFQAFPDVPELVQLAAHALVAAYHRRVGKDGGEVELSVLGVLVEHELRLAAVPPLEVLLDPREDFR